MSKETADLSSAMTSCHARYVHGQLGRANKELRAASIYGGPTTNSNVTETKQLVGNHAELKDANWISRGGQHDFRDFETYRYESLLVMINRTRNKRITI